MRLVLLVIVYCAAVKSEKKLKGSNHLVCYTCMSNNVPNISKDLMRETVNIPEYAESAYCTDPFSSAAHSQIKMTQCDTACIKIVSQNKYIKVVLRGCLSELYNPTQGQPLPDAVRIEYRDVCDQKRQQTTGIGETVTNTCLCTSDYCNTTPRLRAVAALMTLNVLIVAWTLS